MSFGGEAQEHTFEVVRTNGSRTVSELKLRSYEYAQGFAIELYEHLQKPQYRKEPWTVEVLMDGKTPVDSGIGRYLEEKEKAKKAHKGRKGKKAI